MRANIAIMDILRQEKSSQQPQQQQRQENGVLFFLMDSGGLFWSFSISIVFIQVVKPLVSPGAYWYTSFLLFSSFQLDTVSISINLPQ